MTINAFPTREASLKATMEKLEQNKGVKKERNESPEDVAARLMARVLQTQTHAGE